MKRSLAKRWRLLVAMVVMLSMFAAAGAFGKAHVPVGEIQVAHRGVVKQLPAQALDGHLRHGDVQLPACDFNNVFLEGDVVGDVVLNPRDSAEGITPACPVGTF